MQVRRIGYVGDIDAGRTKTLSAFLDQRLRYLKDGRWHGAVNRRRSKNRLWTSRKGIYRHRLFRGAGAGGYQLILPEALMRTARNNRKLAEYAYEEHCRRT